MKFAASVYIRNLHILSEDTPVVHLQLVNMAAPTHDPDLVAHHLAAWREFRGMTQEHLGESVGTTGSMISMLERGERGLSVKWLLRLAPPLQTTPGFIIDHDPRDIPEEVLAIWEAIPTERRDQALRVLETFKLAS